MYSTSSKEKLEAAATFVAVLVLAAAPPVALALIERKERHPFRPGRATKSVGQTANPMVIGA
jgi:hypothetical protein